jgi:molybdenum cofactor sulfurtransferase
VQGPVANFQLLTPAGKVFSYKTASIRLAKAGFHVREGCMCNPGACYAAVGVLDEEVRTFAESKKGNFSDWEWIEVERNGTTVTLPLGTLRVSLGWMSRVRDVDALAEFLEDQYRDRSEQS